MLTTLSFIGGLPNSRGRKDDDGAARLSHRYTSAMLIIFSLIVTMDHIVGQRIQCFTPVHFSGHWQAYSETYCWVKNTYYLPYEDNIPQEHEEDKRQTLTYYQWVPLIMQLQALLFYMPCLIWRSMNDRAGIDVASVLKIIHKFHQTEDAENKEKYINHITEVTNRFLTRRRDKNINFNLSLSFCLAKIFPLCGRRRGNYLTALYLFVKFLYIVNVIGQLFLLNYFMGSSFHMYGFEAIHALMKDQYISESNRFPRVTMCDFKVRMLGNVQRYTVQCVLPINLFHEMIYLFIWFWMVGVAAVSVYSFFVWLGRMVGNLDRHRFMKRYVQHFSDKSLVDKKKLSGFTQNYLGADGVFLLRLIDENTDDLTTHDVAEALWEKYTAPHKPIELTSNTTESTA